MSRGKYSPHTPHARDESYEYKYTCYGKIPEPYSHKTNVYDHKTDVYDQRIHFGDYDDEGFDRYGYSAFDSDGKYVGPGAGVDRLGYTELDYLSMDDRDFYHATR